MNFHHPVTFGATPPQEGGENDFLLLSKQPYQWK